MIDVPLATVGSKRRMIEKLWPHIPRPSSGRIVVPFFGTGADSLFFYQQGFKVLASDAQFDLVRLVNQIETAYARASKLGAIDKERYLEIREEFNTTRDPALFFVLLRCSFNKLCRFNASNEFNVPPADLPKNWLPKAATIDVFADMIWGIDGVECLDFADALDRVDAGDVAYLDPPYWGTFDTYTGKPFDHERLFAYLSQLDVPWAMSNSATRDWSKDFPGAEIFDVDRAGTVNSVGTDRGRVREVLIVSGA